MAAIATTGSGAGNWSATGTWSGGVVPGANDTVTITRAVTVDVNTSVGLTAFTTGGTAAITVGASGAVTVAAGITLTVNGDIKHTADSIFTLAAGSTINFTTPSAQQAVWVFGSGGNNNSYLVANGTSGSRCTIRTSSGLNSIMTNGSSRNNGLITAAYTDFVNFGTATQAGVKTVMDFNNNVTVSITNCTFTGCNYQQAAPGNNAWDGNLTFQGNIFSSSTTMTFGGIAGSCAAFSFSANRTSGTRLIDLCSFDANVGNSAFRQCKVTNSYIAGLFFNSSSSSWPDDSYFNNVLFNWSSSVSGGPPLTVYGSIKNVYLYNTASSNPHFMGQNVAAISYTGLIFEYSGTSADGDGINPMTGGGAVAVKNCIVLPSGSGAASCNLLSTTNAGTYAITCEHNTACAKLVEGGFIHTDETASSFAGEVVSCRSNLIWSPSAGSNNVILIGATGTGTPAVNAVTTAGYNALWNPNTGTCFYNTSTSQSGVVGYLGIKISANTPYPNATIGTGDVDLTSGGGSGFVDSTRNLATWGGTVTGGGTATAAGALATIAANPALIGQSTTGLLAWVRAGFRPTNAALKGTSYSGDTSTLDAAGNSWAGGATPDIGAMAVLSTGGPLFFNRRMNGGLTTMG